MASRFTLLLLVSLFFVPNSSFAMKSRYRWLTCAAVVAAGIGLEWGFDGLVSRTAVRLGDGLKDMLTPEQDRMNERSRQEQIERARRQKDAETRQVRSKLKSDFPGRAKKPFATIKAFEHFPSKLGEPELTFEILVYDYKLKEGSDGYLVHYSGLLYGACSGYCRLQGYTIEMDKSGKVLRFLSSTLAQTAIEYDIPPDGLDRLVDLANNKNGTLKVLYDKGDPYGSAYVARMSLAPQLPGGGNSAGTFQIHLSLVRQELGLSDKWPIFDVGRK